MKRRDFLILSMILAGCFFVTAGVSQQGAIVWAATDEGGRYAFPQGLASGDPTNDSVVLWTRVQDTSGADGPIEVTVEVAEDEAFAKQVLEKTVTATKEADHTLRIIVDGLEPDTIYYYRFKAGGDVSEPHGRTWTAPAPDAERPIRFAFSGSQNYEQGFFGAWRRMIIDDIAKPENERIDFVLNLGDFICEYPEFVGAKRKLKGKRGPLRGQDGIARLLPEFPESETSGILGRLVAETVNDYRHLYKTYLSDPDLRAARARWPFVSTWDDHEFSDQSWQSRSTYRPKGEAAQRRKVSANQAWFEFIPARLSGAQALNGVGQQCRDFAYTEVENTEAADYPSDAHNVAAIGSMTIYRSLRFGAFMELILTDSRSYRSDHAIPEPTVKLMSLLTRAFIPLSMVKAFDAGRTLNNGNAPDTIHMRKMKFPNARQNSPPGTVLGEVQKAWWKDTLRASTAQWKFWANSVAMMPLRLDVDDVNPEASKIVLSVDGWDGYPMERDELMKFLLDEGPGNVVSLSADQLMHFAGIVMETDDGEEARPAMPEFSSAGLSSTSVYHLLTGRSMLPNGARDMAYVDMERFGESKERVELLNLTLLQGLKSSAIASSTGDLEMAKLKRNPGQNPHLRYIDASANGYGLVSVTRDGTDVVMVRTGSVRKDYGMEGPPVVYKAKFHVPWKDKGKAPEFTGPEFEGTPPFGSTRFEIVDDGIVDRGEAVQSEGID